MTRAEPHRHLGDGHRRAPRPDAGDEQQRRADRPRAPRRRCASRSASISRSAIGATTSVPTPMPGDGDTERGGAPAVEPRADGRDHRHVRAGDGGPDADAVGHVAEPDRPDPRREQQRHAEQRPRRRGRAGAARTGRRPARASPTAKYHAVVIENISAGRALAGAELVLHRLEEHAEAVDDAEDDEHRPERGRHHHPARAPSRSRRARPRPPPR